MEVVWCLSVYKFPIPMETRYSEKKKIAYLWSFYVNIEFRSKKYGLYRNTRYEIIFQFTSLVIVAYFISEQLRTSHNLFRSIQKFYAIILCYKA